MSRRKARELALQMLFQQDLTQGSVTEVGELFWRAHPVPDKLRQFAHLLFRKPLEGRSVVDDLIGRNTEHWRMERIAAVDRNVLRLGVTEFLVLETPKVVVIDEAVEIARKYGTERSSEFVNGILDAIRNELESQSEELQSHESES